MWAASVVSSASSRSAGSSWTCVMANTRSSVLPEMPGDNRFLRPKNGGVDTLQVRSVNVAQPEVILRHAGGEVVSSINKKPVTANTLTLTRTNLERDGQADTRSSRFGGQVHGGADQAVYAYPVEHFPRLAEITGLTPTPGFMGENVTIEGAREDDVCIGDVWQWGDATLQVTAPRGPCYKLGIKIGRQSVRKAIREEGLVGWYLRVLQPGTVPTSGAIHAAERHPAGVTVGVAHRALQDRENTYPALAALDVMSTNLRGLLMYRNRDLT